MIDLNNEMNKYVGRYFDEHTKAEIEETFKPYGILSGNMQCILLL